MELTGLEKKHTKQETLERLLISDRQLVDSSARRPVKVRVRGKPDMTTTGFQASELLVELSCS